jgi:hypothetical protein
MGAMVDTYRQILKEAAYEPIGAKKVENEP